MDKKQPRTSIGVDLSKVRACYKENGFDYNGHKLKPGTVGCAKRISSLQCKAMHNASF